jgi:hypothetical protein
VRATRPKDPTAPQFVRELVDWGAGPRAGQFLIHGGKALAAMDGRFSVPIDDVKQGGRPRAAAPHQHQLPGPGRRPYLYDGETQQVSREFGVLATPHVFVFDADRKLRYQGRIDDSDVAAVTSHDTRNAIDALLAGQPVPVETTRVFGCSTKWADKRDSAKQSLQKWNAEPVEIEVADAKQIEKLVRNETENYRLINVWSITCIPCIRELPELVTINRMYRGRPFEMITVCMDPPDQQEAALRFLRKHHVSSKNLIFTSDDKDALAEALDAKWQGPVPYTILVAPGGEIVERWTDEIDPLTVKRAIVDRLGRTYASRKASR